MLLSTRSFYFTVCYKNPLYPLFFFMLYIKLMLRNKPIFNIKFKYINDIIILRINLITFYTVITLITDVKNVFN